MIQIIREEEDPKQALMDRFGLSTVQADAILDLKLRHLAKLEEMKIKSSSQSWTMRRSRLEALLGSERRLTTLMKKSYWPVRKPTVTSAVARWLSAAKPEHSKSRT